jgi:hypothetical protein
MIYVVFRNLPEKLVCALFAYVFSLVVKEVKETLHDSGQLKNLELFQLMDVLAKVSSVSELPCNECQSVRLLEQFLKLIVHLLVILS